MKEVEIKSWEDLKSVEILHSCRVFRGQSCASWPIESSLTRRIKGTDFEEMPENAEFWNYREFRRRAPSYIDRSPSDDDLIGWLSLMQHHGARTRLIDFTHSFYIALYFALKSAKCEPSAVWAINMHRVRDIATTNLIRDPSGTRDQIDDRVYHATNKFLGSRLSSARASERSDRALGISYGEPFTLHKRLSAQQGLFLIPLDLRRSFTDNFEAQDTEYARKNNDIVKYVFAPEFKHVGLCQLKAMNIHEETLFPDLDGMSRSILDKRLCH